MGAVAEVLLTIRGYSMQNAIAILADVIRFTVSPEQRAQFFAIRRSQARRRVK